MQYEKRGYHEYGRSLNRNLSCLALEAIAVLHVDVLDKLIRIIQEAGDRFDPLPTGVALRLSKLPDIKAVVFDVYGTMILSGVGDISMTCDEDRSSIIAKTLMKVGIAADAHDGLSELFYAEIRRQQAERRQEGVRYPEVEIRDVWRSLLWQLSKSGSVSFEDESIETLIEEVAVLYECEVNPVCAEPDLKDTLGGLLSGGMKLGIISNAQFFTRLLFPALLGDDTEGLGFQSEYCVWSYRLKEAKPSQRLYEIAAQNLKEGAGIEASEVLYVGNDMRNDIWPAREVGFRTALYVGDKRSLRLRDDCEECRGVEPDLVIDRLSQLKDCIH